jgi:electron transport complex protein RnfE
MHCDIETFDRARKRLANNFETFDPAPSVTIITMDEPIQSEGTARVRPEAATLGASLGVAPLVAGADTMLKGAELGLATLVALAASGALAVALRPWVPPRMRLPACGLVVAGVVSVMKLLFEAWLFEPQLALGSYLPLVVANLAILARAEALARAQTRVHGRTPAGEGSGILGPGLVAAALLTLAGALREFAGHLGLLRDAGDFFGENAAGLAVSLSATDAGFALALTPAGAFFTLALLLVAWRTLAARRRHA